jgi:hypothetical protein
MSLNDRPATAPSGERPSSDAWLGPRRRGARRGRGRGAVVACRLARAARVSAAVFGIALVGLYSISALYHLGRWSVRGRRWLGRMDGAMIQVFIAATFTPVAVHALGGAWRTSSLVIAWTIALIGAGVAMSPATPPARLSVAAYVAFGSLGGDPPGPHRWGARPRRDGADRVGGRDLHPRWAGLRTPESGTVAGVVRLPRGLPRHGRDRERRPRDRDLEVRAPARLTSDGAAARRR